VGRQDELSCRGSRVVDSDSSDLSYTLDQHDIARDVIKICRKHWILRFRVDAIGTDAVGVSCSLKEVDGGKRSVVIRRLARVVHQGHPNRRRFHFLLLIFEEMDR
jgi:hypothetical protein